MNLTDDEMRVKVATLMGWTDIRVEEIEWGVSESGERLTGQSESRNVRDVIPGYPASVDAALTLCDRLREEGIESELANNDYDLNWEVTLNRAGIKIEYAADPSLARAICLAFLKVQDSVANSL